MKSLLYFLKEQLKDIVCRKCAWGWNRNESDKDDMYICHKCGTDNTKKYETIQTTKDR